MNIWYDVNVQLPANGQHVYFRRLNIEIPYESFFDAVTNTFTTPNGLTISWVYVSKWTAF
jgi:hypothetical protein